MRSLRRLLSFLPGHRVLFRGGRRRLRPGRREFDRVLARDRYLVPALPRLASFELRGPIEEHRDRLSRGQPDRCRRTMRSGGSSTGPKRRMLDETRAREMRRFLVRGGYLDRQAALMIEGQAYREKTALLELHFRTPFKHGVLVSHRLRIRSPLAGRRTPTSRPGCGTA